MFEEYEKDKGKLNCYGILKNPENIEHLHWNYYLKLLKPIIIEEKCARGFQIGSERIGTPTANIQISPKIKTQLTNLINGVYFGYATILTN